MLSHVMRRRAAAAVVVVLAAGGVAKAADSPDAPRTYDLSGTSDTGVRPTAVGLPRIFSGATVGAGEMTAGLISYHDNGRYEADLEAVAGAAEDFLAARLNPGPGVRTCRNRYLRTARRDGRGRTLYRRTRRCTTQRETAPAKPAIVLDIDETSLSNYVGLVASGFNSAGVAISSVTGTGTVIAPVLRLFAYAKAHGVAVFFVTGRPEALNPITTANLKSAGYAGWDGLDNKPSGVGTLRFKSGARAAIEQRGYTIVANVGDQESDLAGGHAERAFKLPNPFYFIPE